MIELGVSQVQSQFPQLLNQTVIIVDQETHHKKAVIIPYEEYEKLIARVSTKENLKTGLFDQFVGVLDDKFVSDDTRYNEILK